MAIPHLLSTGDVGKLLGVSRQRVHQLRAAYDDFPEPVGEVSGGYHVWSETDIKRWARKRPRPGTDGAQLKRDA